MVLHHQALRPPQNTPPGLIPQGEESYHFELVLTQNITINHSSLQCIKTGKGEEVLTKVIIFFKFLCRAVSPNPK